MCSEEEGRMTGSKAVGGPSRKGLSSHEENRKVLKDSGQRASVDRLCCGDREAGEWRGWGQQIVNRLPWC